MSRMRVTARVGAQMDLCGEEAIVRAEADIRAINSSVHIMVWPSHIHACDMRVAAHMSVCRPQQLKQAPPVASTRSLSCSPLSSAPLCVLPCPAPLPRPGAEPLARPRPARRPAPRPARRAVDWSAA